MMFQIYLMIDGIDKVDDSTTRKNINGIFCKSLLSPIIYGWKSIKHKTLTFIIFMCRVKGDEIVRKPALVSIK